jgi:hypothetical protein
MKMTVFRDVAPWGLVALMIEAVSASETSVSFYQTARRNIEDSHLHTLRRENLKYHKF